MIAMMKLFAILLFVCLVHCKANEIDETINNKDCESKAESVVVYREDGQEKSFVAKPACFGPTPDDINSVATVSGVNLELYTSNTQDSAFQLLPSNTDQAPVIKGAKTVALIHGWLEKGDKTWVLETKDKYLSKGTYNIIAVDWQKLAIGEYNICAGNTKKVGEFLGAVLSNFISSGAINASDIHLAGHSLGAHVAGIAGHRITQNTKKLIGRITGMDAAAPGFEYPLILFKNKRLDKSDAEFVEGIHTDSGIFGFYSAYGHADFYPNGGTAQPGCFLENICNHQRSCDLFEDSVNSHSLIGKLCTSWSTYQRGLCDNDPKQYMGENTATNATGNYYLKTNSHSPFGLS